MEVLHAATYGQTFKVRCGTQIVCQHCHVYNTSRQNTDLKLFSLRIRLSFIHIHSEGKHISVSLQNLYPFY